MGRHLPPDGDGAGSNTRFTYNRDLTRNMLPRFGSRALSAIRPVDIRLWLAAS